MCGEGGGRRTDGSESEPRKVRRAVPVRLEPSARRGWVGSSGRPGEAQDTPCAKAAPDWCFCVRLCAQDTVPSCESTVLHARQSLLSTVRSTTKQTPAL
jgi:hypothetical protein